MYYTQEQIDRANQADLVSFLQSQGEQLTRAGNEYRWKRHDSLTVRGNKWYRHSQSKGGGPVDFVMEFFGKSFTEAVELLTGEKGAAPPPDRHCPAPLSDFRLPPRSTDNRIARNYLTAARRIDEDVTGFFFSTGDIYEEAAHHNAVFVGRDESGIPRYAHQRGTAGSFRLDVKGSDKAFNFCYRGEGERLFVFEAPIRPVVHVSSVNDELLSAVGKLTAEYGRIGGNLNQIARYLNEYGVPYNTLSGEVRAAISDLAVLKYEVLKKVGDAVGNTQAYQL